LYLLIILLINKGINKIRGVWEPYDPLLAPLRRLDPGGVTSFPDTLIEPLLAEAFAMFLLRPIHFYIAKKGSNSLRTCEASWRLQIGREVVKVIKTFMVLFIC
jgi:hypothetical protein